MGRDKPHKIWFGWAAIWIGIALICWIAHFSARGLIPVSELPRRPNLMLEAIAYATAFLACVSLSVGIAKWRHEKR